jgi:phosphoserine phosphatase
MDRPDSTDATAAAPPGEGPDPGGAAAAPASDLVLHEELGPLLVRVLGTYVRRLWALLVVASLPAVPVTLLSQALVVAPAREGSYLNGVLESTADPLAPALLIATGVIVLAGLAIAPVVLGGSVLLGAAALLGRRISPRQAWQGGRQRYFTVLTWFLLLIFLVLGVSGLALWALVSDLPPVLTAIVFFVVLWVLLTPVTVSLPLALVEGHGPFRALVEACRLARHRFGVHLILVGLSYGVSVLAGTGLEWALVRWTDLPEGGPVLSAATVLAALLATPLSVLLSCAPLAYAEALELIGDHRRAGRDVWIVSSSGEEIVEPFARFLGVRDFLATRSGIDDQGRYDGTLEFYAYAGAKATAMRQVAEVRGYDLSRCYAYTDSITDLPMLSVVGHPTAVNPDKELRAAALAMGWDTRDFTAPVRLRDRLPAVERKRDKALVALLAGAVVGAVAWAVVRPSPDLTDGQV